MRLVWDENAWEDYLWWQALDRETLKRINLLVRDMARNGHKGIGKPEPASPDPLLLLPRSGDGVGCRDSLSPTGLCAFFLSRSSRGRLACTSPPGEAPRRGADDARRSSRTAFRDELRPVVIVARGDPDLVTGKVVHEAVFVVDAPVPVSGEIVLEVG